MQFVLAFGLLLSAATVLAYPLADNVETDQKSSQQAVIIPAEVAKPQPVQRDVSASAESSSEESSEEPKLATTEAASSEETTRTELPASTAQAPSKREEPKLDEPEKIEAAAKPEEPAAAKKIDETPAPAAASGDVKALAEPLIPDVVQAAKDSPAIAEEAKVEIPLDVTTERIEKPLALPALEGKKDDLAPAPTEIKEEIVPAADAAQSSTAAPLASSSQAPATTLAAVEEQKESQEKSKREEPAAAAAPAAEENTASSTTLKAAEPIAKVEGNLKNKSEAEIPEKLPEPSASA